MSAYASKKKRARKKKIVAKSPQPRVAKKKAKARSLARKLAKAPKPKRASVAARKKAARKTAPVRKTRSERKVTPKKRVKSRPKPPVKKRGSAVTRKVLRSGGRKAAAPPRKRPSKAPALKKRRAAPAKAKAVRKPARKVAAVKKKTAKRSAAQAKRVKGAATRKPSRKRSVPRKAQRVAAKHKKLRLEAEKLRLRHPRTTKRKLKEVRKEVNAAVGAPPKDVDYTEVFNELFELARKKQQLPNIDFKRTVIRSERATGRKKQVRIDMLLTEDAVEPILYKVRQVVKRMGGFHIWMAGLIMSSMGPEIVGSGGRVLLANHPLAFKFQTEAHDSTGVFNSSAGMMDKLETMLEKLAGSEHHSLVYLHSVTVSHFTRKNVGS